MLKRAKNYLKRKKKKIKKQFDFSTEGKRKRVIDNPPAIDPESIVFTSNTDYTGNPKALFLHMIEHGYNQKYKITWLFGKRENYIDFGLPNVYSVCMRNEKGERTPEAQRAIMSAHYIFYSHNVNWCKKFRDGQEFIDLWHGCGYKGDLRSDKTKIYYDHVMVTGKKYIDIFKDVLKDPDGDVLDLGYPRNEFLFTNKSEAANLLAGLKKTAGAEKVIMWLPTFRKSTLQRLDSDTAIGETGLPVLYTNNDLKQINDFCRDNKVLLLLKQHYLQSEYDVAKNDFHNLLFINDKYLLENGADFYEMMARSDAMLTDYSSVAIDYMLVDKPMGFTLDDYDQYEEARGWSFENVKDFMSGHHICTIEEMEAFIRDIALGKDPHKEWRARVTEEAHTYKDGFSQRILDHFGI